jgi:hypothetical protein
MTDILDTVHHLKLIKPRFKGVELAPWNGEGKS